MIIVNVFGGIGNQMFQYAIGRHLSQKLKTNLKFEYSINLTRNDFDPLDIPSIFDIFELKGKVVKDCKYENYFVKLFNFVEIKLLAIFKRQCKFVKESNFRFNKDILLLPNNCYLSGYWQSENYFKDSEDLLRRDFQIKKPMNLNNVEIAKTICQVNSISIHLRGRDYITNEQTKKSHYTCDNLYYERSINLMKEKLKDPHFFIFSDDPEWARKFLNTDSSFTFVEGNSWNKTSYEDLRLMSLCKHNIIANSSFSWWGAWLNSNIDKIVIAPKKWFSDADMNNQTEDLVPGNWLRL